LTVIQILAFLDNVGEHPLEHGVTEEEYLKSGVPKEVLKAPGTGPLENAVTEKEDEELGVQKKKLKAPGTDSLEDAVTGEEDKELDVQKKELKAKKAKLNEEYHTEGVHRGELKAPDGMIKATIAHIKELLYVS
jgi:hypothetical protein